MARKALRLAGGVLLAASAASIVWEWLCVSATREFFQRSASEGEGPAGSRAAGSATPAPEGAGGQSQLPKASILMPLRGASPENRASILSMLKQDYPSHDVIVGVATNDEAAAGLVSELQRSPGVMARPGQLQLASGPNRLGGMPKVGNLHNALQLSQAPFIAMVDADIVAGPDFLRRFLSPLLTPQTGLTTCLYRASPGGSLWNRADAIWNSTTYLPSALFGRKVIGESFAFGAAIGIRRDVLDQIGGYAAIAPRVGDDYQMGHRAASLGYRVRFVPYVVTEQMERISFLVFLNRRIRWSRTIRTYQAAGYAGSIITYGFPLALAAAMLAPRNRGRWRWLAVVLANRTMCAALNRRWIEPGRPPAEMALVPIRDVVALVVWGLGFTKARRRLPVGVAHGPLPGAPTKTARS